MSHDQPSHRLSSFQTGQVRNFGEQGSTLTRNIYESQARYGPQQEADRIPHPNRHEPTQCQWTIYCHRNEMNHHNCFATVLQFPRRGYGAIEGELVVKIQSTAVCSRPSSPSYLPLYISLPPIARALFSVSLAAVVLVHLPKYIHSPHSTFPFHVERFFRNHASVWNMVEQPVRIPLSRTMTPRRLMLRRLAAFMLVMRHFDAPTVFR